MSSGLYTHTTRAVGTILTAAIYNSDHVNHITNHNPSMMGGYSDNVAQMQLMVSPGGVGSEDLAGNLAGELERIRFAIDRIVGKTHWYEAPAANLEQVGGTITDLTVTETVSFSGDLTPSQIIATQNNYAPTGHDAAFRFRLSSDATRTITGLAGGADGRIVALDNAGSFNIVLSHEDVLSTAANRFSLITSTTLRPGESLSLQYDAVTSRWRPYQQSIRENAVDLTRLADASATARILARVTAGAGDFEEATLSQVLDLIGSAAHGDILYRDTSLWARLAAGTSGQFLQTQGAGANPIWASINQISIGSLLTFDNDPAVDTNVPSSGGSVWLYGLTIISVAAAGHVQVSLDGGSTYTNLPATTPGSTLNENSIGILFINNGILAAAGVAETAVNPSIIRAAPTAGGDVFFKTNSINASGEAVRVM